MNKYFNIALAFLCVSCGAQKNALENEAAVQSSQNEVINTGYGTTTAKSSTYSIQKVKMEDKMDIGSYTTIYDYLKGRCPGVEIGPASLGQAPSVRIRGINSINSSCEPLYVVDGTPVNDLSSVNPHDVYSVEILKDASASMYGVRGANGVLLVTTKSGHQQTEEAAAARKAARQAAKSSRKAR